MKAVKNQAMSAKDVFHDTLKRSLQKDGWTITHDPLVVDLSDGQLYIDLGAERLIAAKNKAEQIPVEIKSFLAPSAMSEFHTAVGQFLNYRVALRIQDPARILYLAVTLEVYEQFFSRKLPQLSIQEYHLKLLVFDPENEVIVQWQK